jgi:DNA mismatch endonuclease (patch repair protein)
MADTVSKSKRSKIMGKIKSTNTKMEVLFNKRLAQSGLRYKRNVAKLFGKPDFVFTQKRLVIFLDSCFWHGCKKHCRIPATRKDYWAKKIERNFVRDKEVNRYYKKLDWKVIRIWEHNLKNFELGKYL